MLILTADAQRDLATKTTIIIILLFLDIKAAFPSLAWAYLWAILEALGMPIGYRSFFRSLYVGVRAWVRFRGSVIEFGWINNGVNQGCPASAFLFAVAINQILDMIVDLIGSPSAGLACACADDIGLCLRDLGLLVPLSAIFEDTRNVTGLILGVPKCIIVPLWGILSETKEIV